MEVLSLRDHYDTVEELLEDFESKNDSNWYLSILSSLCEQCDNGSVVELGTWQGQSLALFIHAHFDYIVSCDIDLSRVDIPLFHRLAEKEGVHLEFREFNSLRDELPIKPDLLFIDTMHTYEHVRAELALHAPKVKRFIAIHDTNYPPPRKNPDRLVRDAVLDFLKEERGWQLLIESNAYTGMMVIERV